MSDVVVVSCYTHQVVQFRFKSLVKFLTFYYYLRGGEFLELCGCK